MELYFAPLEGITTYTYRNTHAELFDGCDEYYAPFIVPTDNERLSLKSLRDIKSDNNRVNLIPQVMCSTPQAFKEFERKIKEIGYNEVNINFGCPSGTVVHKLRGAGALKDKEALDRLLYNIFSEADIEISIKTRTGFYSHDEFDALTDVYKKYPLSRLIVHPRIREEYYRGEPNYESYEKAYKVFKEKTCYNGNIYSVNDYIKVTESFPETGSVMIGRGAIANPAIFREIKGGKRLSTSELINFSNLLEKRYLELFKSETNVLRKLKEIWMHIVINYPDQPKIIKAIKKSSKLSHLNSAIGTLPELK